MLIPDGKVNEANMGPTWVLSAPDGSYVGPMNFAIWDVYVFDCLHCGKYFHWSLLYI